MTSPDLRAVRYKPLASCSLEQDELLSAKQLAHILQISLDTLARWRTTGEGPAFHHVGRYVRYSPVDVNAWLAARRTTSTTRVAV